MATQPPDIFKTKKNITISYFSKTKSIGLIVQPSILRHSNLQSSIFDKAYWAYIAYLENKLLFEA